MTHIAQDVGGVHAEGCMPVERRIVSAPLPSAMQVDQTTHDVSLGRGLFEDGLVDAVYKSVGVIANGSDRLAMDDDAPLEKL